MSLEDDRMSGTNHRTWQTFHVGSFLATIQLDPVADSHCFEQHAELARVTKQLIDLMDTHRMPVTWAVSDPAHSAATAQIMQSPVAHQFAVLGDAAWMGPLAGRTRFARELSRRVTQARGYGLQVHTLVPRDAMVDHNIDLIVKQQITAVAGVASVGSRAINTPRALHYGVWELPITATLPARGSWFSNTGWRMGQRIRQFAKDAGMFHLVIDAPSLCSEGARIQQMVARLVRHVANMRDRGQVRVETLHEAASRLADVPAVRPQQSILRRAA